MILNYPIVEFTFFVLIFASNSFLLNFMLKNDVEFLNNIHLNDIDKRKIKISGCEWMTVIFSILMGE
jgi:hypothetical protein